jgi:CRISPR-associated protein Csm3
MTIMKRGLRGRVLYRSTMLVETGLHIGAAESELSVGGIDKLVVRDPVTNEPFVPGSSLRGKLRSLLERRDGLESNRQGGAGIRRHECDTRELALACPVCGLFGSVGASRGANHPSPLAVRDAFLTTGAAAKLKRLSGLTYMTEWKFENALDRITAAANPRQLERVPRGAEFAVELSYAVEDVGDDVPRRAQDDLNRLLASIRLLEADALGGHGSRGYGKVSFQDAALFAGLDDDSGVAIESGSFEGAVSTIVSRVVGAP